MKTKNLCICLLLVLTGCGTRMTFKVSDDFGKPIAEVPVKISQFDHWEPGEGFGEDIHRITSGMTETNGLVTIKVRRPQMQVTYWIGSLPGFYRTEGGTYGFKMGKDGNWQPWNPTIEVLLKPIMNPVPMYHGVLSDKKIPIQGNPVGFDLVKGDWVAPYGKGESSDFVFQLDSAPEKTITNWWGDKPRLFRIHDNKLTLTFSNEGDGIILVVVPQEGRSELRLPRQAPLDGYQPVLIKRAYDEITGMDGRGTLIKHHLDYQADGNYFFRVRTKKDAQGRIVSALYGQIYGDLNTIHGGWIGNTLSFSYYLNPESNSRNMEFDAKRDLKAP